jgi:diguanylate cyclase (GGDEF)-like protein/PAS domain S-box-containing protein
MTALHSDRHREIQALFEDYIEMYASRDDRLTTHFSENFSGYTGSGNFLVRSREEWIRITRQDFSQVPGRIRIEMLDLELQDISDDVVVSTAFFHIHLPTENQVLSSEVARLVLIFRREGESWKIVHSGISIPYHPTQDGEVYPLKSLREQNAALMALVEERTRALNQSESLYRQLTEDTQDVIWKADANLYIAYISPADERLRGFKAEEVVGHHVFEMFNEEGIAAVRTLMQQRAVAEQSGALLGCLTFEAEHRCKDGRWLWGEVQSNPVRDAHGAVIGYHGITREITQRKRLEEQVQQLAFHDPLTGLANRRLLLDRLTQNIFSTQRTGRYSALAFLDLDKFKGLNDAYGHSAGDLLLVEVASRLKSCVRAVDTVARFGGDEFVVLLGELSAERDSAIAQANTIVGKLCIQLATPYHLNVAPGDLAGTMIEHCCSASIGVVVFNGSEASAEKVIDWADAAMYRAKEGGRNQIRFHEATAES